MSTLLYVYGLGDTGGSSIGNTNTTMPAQICLSRLNVQTGEIQTDTLSGSGETLPKNATIQEFLNFVRNKSGKVDMSQVISVFQEAPETFKAQYPNALNASDFRAALSDWLTAQGTVTTTDKRATAGTGIGGAVNTT